MKSVTPLLIAFVAWCFLSTNWYVCTIKQLCKDTQVIATTSITEPIEVSTEPIPIDSPQVPLLSDKKDMIATTDKKVAQHYEVEELGGKVIIHFPSASAVPELDAELEDYLNGFVNDHLVTNELITVAGHTDNTGTTEGNYQLGLRRARKIGALLVAKGIPEERINVISKGERAPIESNETLNGRNKNRRVELIIQKQ